MAVIIKDKTKCALCGKIIKEQEKIIAIPDFSYNEKDLLNYFSNKVFHKNCYISHPLSNLMDKKLKCIEKRYDEKKCYISKELITIESIQHPDNHIFTGILTDNSLHPLFKFNNIHLNKRYLEFWDELDMFKNLLTNEITNNKLMFKGLLIELETPIHAPLKKEIIERYKKRKGNKIK